MGRLSRPLNKRAIKKADTEFYAEHPERVKNGQRIPLSANDTSQSDLHKEWQQLYQQHGGEIETAQEQFAAKKPDDPVQPCPLQPKNWIDLEYFYAVGEGISGARYEVFDATTDGLLTAGALNGKGKAHVDLPLEIKSVKVKYFADPVEVETMHLSQPEPFPEPPGWFDRMTENIKSAGNWTWAVIQGDFNENPTMGQIATNAVITAIPVVDQVADVRDIVAIVKQMVWDKRNDIATWFALFITVIGLVPTVGSLLKGMLKAIWHGAKLNELLKLFNYFKKSNGVKWLKELRAGKLKEYAKQAADNAHQLFDALSQKLTQLKAHVPKAMSDTHKALDDTLTRLGEIKGQINSKFAEIAESLKEKLGKSLDDAGDELSLSNTQTRSTRRQELEEPVSDGYNKGKINKTPLSQTEIDEILSTPKGIRPDASTYLSKEYMAAHAALFKDGAARIQPSAPTGKIGRTETWVTPIKTAKDAIEKANGDPRKLEKLLGFDTGYLGDSPILVEIPKINGYKIPTGNEFAAYDDFWRPAGLTYPGGLPEAVINPVLPGDYTIKPIFRGE